MRTQNTKYLGRTGKTQNPKISPDIFKAYDIRGVYPKEINEETVYKIAQAYAKFLNFPKRVALGKDVRLSSPSLWRAAAKGLTDCGVNVVDIGTGSTDMYYFATANYNLDGGMMISASHNDKEYNGIKMVRENSIPISGDTGIYDIKKLVLEGFSYSVDKKGKVEKIDILNDYINKIISFVEPNKIKKFRIIANTNFGMAGKVLEKIAIYVPTDIIKLNFDPDGNFPKGKPDPLIAENRKEMSQMVVDKNADFGVVWDADADRCFFIDRKGRFMEGSYVLAILAKIMLAKNPGAKVIADPRIVGPTKKATEKAGGKLILSKAGHSFIKERMRKEDAVYAGENSGHYFFRDFFYCDNGMIPLLLIMEYLSESDKDLADLNDYYIKNFSVSGEINLPIGKDTSRIFKKLKEEYPDGEQNLMDGLSITYSDWRFNLRASNTESLVRLNVEASSQKILEEKKDELLCAIKEN